MPIEMTFQHYLLGLFAVANNFSALGMFLAICQGQSQKDILKLSLIATLTAFFTMTITLFTGQMILEFFGISLNAFRTLAIGVQFITTGIKGLFPGLG